MDFSEDWKSLFPVSISCSSPVLIPSSARPTLGPLIFNPIAQTLTHVFSSSSLLPPPLYIPQLSLSRFLITSCPDAPVLPSTASSIASLCGPQFQNNITSILHYNRLEFLKYGNSVIIFFPTGVNSEKVGFLILHVEGSSLRLQLDGNGDIFRVASGACYNISRILVNPIDDEGGDDLGKPSTIGYLLASTCNSAHWFSVQYNSSLERPSVAYMGGKFFKTCSVAHACWSSHIREESLVLLESGELFLFDLEYYMKNSSSNGNFKGTRLKVPWHDSNCSDDKVWLSCEFSWHPRILIVARSDAVFLVDLSADKCVVSCLLKVDVLHMHTRAQNERFLALSRASPDGFYFTVASTNFLLLCDVRKHMMPIIRWAHGLTNPSFMNVLNLSKLRSHSREDTFKLASEVGFCIILGSFWSGEFNLFCYGTSLPSQRGSLASKLSNKTFYAWELPYEIVLSGRDCLCGSCLLKEELSKAALPNWIDWQMKKEIVLGFGIVNSDLASLLCEPYKYGGFTLVRLMSSGKLELQRYEASWIHDRKLENCHEQGLHLDKYLLFTVGDEKCKYRKNVVFHKLNYIDAYRRGNLTKLLVKKLKDPCVDAQEKGPFDVDVHEFLCEKLNACGVGPFRTSPAIIAFFKDVKPSANLHDVALRGLWAELPLDLLQLAFSKHSESLDIDVGQKKVALEFLAVPSRPELPPFFLRKSSSCSNKGSNKVQCDGDIVGPVLPLPILLVLHEIYDGCSDLEDGKFSVEAELDAKYNEILKVAGEISASISGSEVCGNHEVSLAEDTDETWVDPSKLKPFWLYRPASFKCCDTNLVYGNSSYRDKIHDTLIFHVSEEKNVSNDKSESDLVGPHLSDDLCLVELGFNAPTKKIEHGGLKAFDILKRQLSKWQVGVDSYKELAVQSGFVKPVCK
ncbi:uncharacterized protein LOC129313025 [Prosopis cineraria]|uniref:uncharacterized protein LOC129313025 n=1 Tax=Prosopis cineraria TaxID=364024 RepID=UPI00240FD28D|nr:uncharacterized protein LOC129313025 [Prosopis cineraria]